MTTLDPGNRSQWATLSDGDLSVSGIDGLGGAVAPAASTTAKTSGKWAVELTWGAASSAAVAFIDGAIALNPAQRCYGILGGSGTNIDGPAPDLSRGGGVDIAASARFPYVGGTARDQNQDCVTGENVAFAPGTFDVVTLLIDIEAGTLYIALNGVFYAGQDPAIGKGYALPGGISSWQVMAGTRASTDKATLRFSGHTYAFAGFSAWDDDAGAGSGIDGTLAAMEAGADSAAFVGAVALRGMLAAAESGADAASLSGSVPVAGALGGIEAGSDTAVLTGAVAVHGAVAAQESGGDSADLSGRVAVSGGLSAAEAGSDMASFRATERAPITGGLAVSEVGADSCAMVGTVVISGAMAAAEGGADSASVAGAVRISGRLVAMEAANDNVAMAGGVRISGALAAVEAGSDAALFTDRGPDLAADIANTGRWLALRAGSRTITLAAECRILVA